MSRNGSSPLLAVPFFAALLLAGCVGGGGVETVAVPEARTYEGPACPAIVVQSGAEARTVYSGNTADPSRIRYQAGILAVSRTCSILGDVVSVNIDVAGRFVGGPAAQAGTVRDTLRVAIVGDGGTVLSTRDYALSGTLAAPLFGQDFHVTDSIVVPAAPVGVFYRVMVGIDQG
ncbi:MAG: hypothetical protein IT534_05705 [Bauldia sp.]|nr:hypothetical protein [Bauldia sp.]